MRKLLGWLFVASFAIVSRGATNITADVTLDADADWRAAGKVTIAAGVTVDLNGHNLKIAGLAGEGCFTTTAVSVPVPEVINSQAMFWLDAADTSTLTITAEGQVSAWRSKVGTRVATLQSPDVAPTYSATGFALPCVDFGTCGSKKSLSYDRFTNIRTAFAVMKLQKSCNAAFLTDRAVYDFYRGQKGEYLHSQFSNDNAQHVWNGTNEVANPSVDVIPDGSFQVLCYEMKIAAHSDTLAMDRPDLALTNPNQAPFNGGKQISELILFNSVLSEADRLAVTAYLQQKWGFVHVPRNEVHLDVSGTVAADYSVQSIAVGEGVEMVLGAAQMGAACDLCGLGTVRVDGVVDMNGHELHVNGLAGQGTLTSLAPPVGAGETLSVPTIVTSGSMFWLDATDKSTLTVDDQGNVSAWRSKVGTRVATLQSSDVAPTYAETGFRLPCVDFGACGSKKNLSYDRFTNIRTVFTVMKLQKSKYAALLTDRNTYHFFRGDNGAYLHSQHSIGNAQHVYNGIHEVLTPSVDVLPDDDFQVLCYEMAINACSDTLAMDRPGSSAQANYNGGKQISELILFDSVLSEADRIAVTEYLQQKWGAYRTDFVPLYVNVPEDRSVKNTVALEGQLKLIKEGGGTYNAVRQQQTYRGGTLVRAGMATMPLSGKTDSSHSLGHQQYGLSGNQVVVEPGATFDTKGYYDSFRCDVVLNGGTLANTGWNQENYKTWGCAGNLTLTTNSQYRVNYWTAHSHGQVDLGGHELEVVSSSSNGILIFYKVAPTNGVIKTRGDTYLQFESNVAMDLRTVDLVLGTAVFVLDSDINVRNLTTVDYTGEGHVGPSGRQRHVNIHGIYKPFTDYAHYFALQDGATIDLSERMTELDLTNKSFVFAPDAEIRINLGNRRVPSTECLIKWDAKPENVKFLSMRNESGCFESREDGLYRFRGLTIYIR